MRARRKKINQYPHIVGFRIDNGMLKGLELLARKKRIGVSEFLRNCISELLERKVK